MDKQKNKKEKNIKGLLDLANLFYIIAMTVGLSVSLLSVADLPIEHNLMGLLLFTILVIYVLFIGIGCALINKINEKTI